MCKVEEMGRAEKSPAPVEDPFSLAVLAGCRPCGVPSLPSATPPGVGAVVASADELGSRTLWWRSRQARVPCDHLAIDAQLTGGVTPRPAVPVHDVEGVSEEPLIGVRMLTPILLPAENEGSRPEVLTLVARVLDVRTTGFPSENLFEPKAGAVGRTSTANPIEYVLRCCGPTRASIGFRPRSRH
jgi:hypothetical protein